jgi:hypothetical protein
MEVDVFFAAVLSPMLVWLDLDFFCASNPVSEPILGYPLLVRCMFFGGAPLVVLWILLRGRLGFLSAPLAGVFAAASVFSITAAAVMGFRAVEKLRVGEGRPLLIGALLIVVCGSFAMAGFAYIRNAMRAFHLAGWGDRRTLSAAAALLAAVLMLGGPLAAEMKVERVVWQSIRLCSKDTDQSRAQARQVLHDISWYPYKRTAAVPIAVVCHVQVDDEHGKPLRELYQSLTGDDLSHLILLYH